jgi:hypothetical protein
VWSKFSFLRWVKRPRSTAGTVQPRATRRPRLRVEGLEDRSVPAVVNAIAQAAQVDFAGPMARAGYDLAYLYNEYLAYTSAVGPQFGSFQPSNPLLQVSGGAVVVNVLPVASLASTEAALAPLGFQLTSQSTYVASGTLPIASLAAAAGLPSVRAIQPGYRPITSAGPATGQGAHAIHSDGVVNFLGYDGTGVTVGILSDSFGNAGTTGGGALPNSVNVLDDSTGGTDEGRAMAEVVHQVAPGAGIAFATAGTTQSQFANNIRALANAGANVLVDDFTFLTEPMFQDGLVAQAVDEAVAAGIPYFSAAGNLGSVSYEQGFRNSGVNLGTDGAGKVTTDATFMAHDFDPGPGVSTFQTLTLPPGVTNFSFQWSDPFFSVSGGSGAKTDLDIAVFDMAGNFLATVGGFTRNVGGDPVEVFSVGNPGTAPMQVRFAIGKVSGPDPTLMKYVAFRPGTSDGVSIDTFATNSSTTFGHANAAGAETVGAALYSNTPAFGQNPPLLEPYSSRGGTPILFAPDGTPVSLPLRQTPDITAPDGVGTTFFGEADPGGGPPSFFGTSAAAPHAAGVAALMLQVHPGLTPAEIYSAMESTALDIGLAGYDRDSGWGLIQAHAAVAAVGGPFAVTFTGTDGADDLKIRRDASGLNVDFFEGGVLRFEFPASEISSIAVNGKGGGDTLTLDVTNGLIDLPIAYDGGTGADSLVVVGNAFPQEITARADTDPDPTVTLTSGSSPPLAIKSVETAVLTPGNGQVFLTGDNNFLTAQEDSFRVRGTGPTAFAASINGSPAIQFVASNALTVLGGQLTDTLDISPWASNSPAGWGVQSSYDAGVGPPGGDVLVYHTVEANPVSEDLVIQPAGPRAGEIRSTSAAGGSQVAVISFANADLVIDNDSGYGTTTDTLTLRGTTSADQFLIDLTAPGTATAPVVQALAAGVVTTLYRLRSFTGFDTLHFQALGGNDLVQVIAGASDGSIGLVVDLGGSAGDMLQANGTGGGDRFHYVPGAAAGGGTVEVTRASASAPTGIAFVGAGGVTFDGNSPGATTASAADQVVLDGTNGADTITLAGGMSSGGSGDAQVNAGPSLFFPNVGPGSTLALNGFGGNDAFALGPPLGTPFGTISIDGGGGADEADFTGTGGDDLFTYDATGSLTVETPVGTAPFTYGLLGVETVGVDGLGQDTADRLVVVQPVPWTPTPGSGTVPTTPPLSYRNIELLTVTQLPVAGADAATTNEDTPVLIDVLANDAIAATGPATLTVETPPAHGTATVVGGQVRYTPASNYNDAVAGPDSFTYRVTDANGNPTTATVTVHVTPVNDPPVAFAQSVTATEDRPISFAVGGDDGDPEAAQALTFAVVVGPAHGTLLGFNPATGTATYVPAPNYAGPDSITFSVTDDATAGGPARTATGVVTITVASVNDVPVALPQSVSAPPGTSTPITLTGDDGDPEADQTLTFIIVMGPANGTLSGFDPHTGRVTYTAAPNYTGPDSFAFIVADDGSPPLLSNPAVVSINVARVNHAPTAADQTTMVAEGGSAPIALTGDDGDPDATQALTFTIRTGPAHGTLTAFDPATGTATYVPAPGYAGPDSITFTVTDDATAGGPALTSTPATVSITVTPGDDGGGGDGDGGGGGNPPGNHAPVVFAQTVEVHQDGSAVITLTGDDGDPAAIQSLAFAVASGPAHGTLTPLGGGTRDAARFLYTPVAGYTGPDNFTFTATDDTTLGGTALTSAAAGVSVTVLPTPKVLVAGAGAGGGPHVETFDGSGQVTGSFFAYDSSFTGGVRVAAGDVDGDGIPDVVTVPGPGGAANVKVFSGKDGSLLASFFAFDPAFTGGATVAVGNLDGQPGGEVVVAAGPGAGPHVRVFKVAGGEATQLPGPLGSFFAFDPSFDGGVSMAVGNFDGLSGDELVVGAASLGGSHVRVFAQDGTVLASFFAFGPGVEGVSVALADVDGDGRAEIVAGPGGRSAPGGPTVRIFEGGTGELRAEVPVFDTAYTDGVVVTTADRNGDGRPDILVSPTRVARSIEVYDARTLDLLQLFDPFDAAFPGGVDVSGS